MKMGFISQKKKVRIYSYKRILVNSKLYAIDFLPQSTFNHNIQLKFRPFRLVFRYFPMFVCVQIL